MTPKFTRRIGTAAVLAATAVLPAMAQDEAATQPEVPAFEMPVYAPQWSSPQIEKLAGMLAGSWATSQDVPVFGSGDASEKVGVVMSIAPAPVIGMSDTLYVETARADRTWEPFRHAIFELFEYQGSIRMRTYELAMDSAKQEIFTGLWAQPGYFPALDAADLIATMDVAMTEEGAGFAGESPYPYPTGTGGAVEMTSSVEVTKDRFTTSNVGTDASGGTAWRANYTFIKGTPAATASVGENGMVIVDFVNPGEVVVADGDQLHIHYAGWTTDMTQFDASRPKGRPFLFVYPPGNRAIVGWGLGMEGISIGTHRRLVIPGYLAYGERGNPRANIAPDQTLYFEVECVHIDKPEAPSEADSDEAESLEADADEADSAVDHSGHDHD
ncbi:MAG: hypothetical protein ACI89L_001268 [Phycisphaerales bacterium]|jgi:hypothetical protein